MADGTEGGESGEGSSEQEHLDSMADQVAEGLGLIDEVDDKGETREEEGSGEPSGKASDTASQPAPQVAAAAPTAPAVADPNDKAPDSWKPEMAAKWAAVDPDIKAEIRRRENDFAEGIVQYKNTAAIGEKFGKAIEKYIPVWQANKVDPWSTVTEMLEAHALMSFGTPEQKIGFFTAMAKYSGIDLTKLAEGGTAAAASDYAQVHGSVAGLRRELAAAKAEIASVAGNLHSNEVNKLEAQVHAFASDPAHPYFTELESDIEQLLSRGLVKTLDQAYEKAVWANPVTRAKEIARQAQVAETARLNKLRERTGNARKASAVNVRSRTSRGAAPTHGGSIDETLRETLSDIHSRD